MSDSKNNKYIASPFVGPVLFDPIAEGADELVVISGYAGHLMASWHIKQIEERRMPPVKITLVVGMCRTDGIDEDVHNGFKELMSMHEPKRSTFECKYVCQGSEVHSKIYIWLRNRVPFKAFAGSANYTQKAFGNARREYMTECDAVAAYEYYNRLEPDTIFCNHAEVEEHVLIAPREKIRISESDNPADEQHGDNTLRLSLLTRTGEVGYGSGLNWGHRRDGTRRNPNETYIPVPAKVARSGFFPLNKTHFTIVMDDGVSLIVRLEQANDKALTTPMSNARLGEYLRNRLGVANGAYVTKEDLEAYGRTDVTFYKIDDEQFFADFGVDG